MPHIITPPLARLLNHVEQTNTCWLWTGKITRTGYGQIQIGSRTVKNRKTVYVHRLAYESLVGPIPDGYTLDHVCRVRRCVNPAHLRPMTQRENNFSSPDYIGNRTHCKNGHPLDLYRKRQRTCSVCCAAAVARYRARHPTAGRDAQRRYRARQQLLK